MLLLPYLCIREEQTSFGTAVALSLRSGKHPHPIVPVSLWGERSWQHRNASAAVRQAHPSRTFPEHESCRFFEIEEYLRRCVCSDSSPGPHGECHAARQRGRVGQAPVSSTPQRA